MSEFVCDSPDCYGGYSAARIVAERDAAVAHLRAILADGDVMWPMSKECDKLINDAEAFLAGLDDPAPVPVQQDEPEGVCAFPNCSCTENRCPAKGERGPFCDHGFHPRLCGRCAPVPEAVTDEDEVQCQMCKTVQPRPDKECGHCGAGPKYLCPIHTRPDPVPVQQDEPCDECGCIGLCDPRCSQVDPDPTVPVQQDELQMTPNESKDLESGPVQQDEPEFDESDMEREVVNTRRGLERGKWDSPTAMLRSRAYSVLNQLDQVPGSLPWSRIKLEAAVRVFDEAQPVPVQQEPELDGSEVNATGGSDGHDEAGDSTASREATDTPTGLTSTTPAAIEAGARALKDHKDMRVRCFDQFYRPLAWDDETEATREDYRQQAHVVLATAPPSPVPSVGLRDRLACELANLEHERSGRLCETDEFYDDADRVLSVLHEAGTQGDCEHCATRRKDRERVADYLASAQRVEFRDLNANARREWLMRASDALRAVWSIGRLTDPVQRESEDRITRPGGWHGMMMLTDAAYRSGYEYRKAEFAPVPSVGLRDRVACELANLEHERSGRLCETDEFYDDADRVLSVLHEAGTQCGGGLVHSLAVALMTATTEAQEGIKPSDEALQHRDALVQRARAAGEGQRQHREMFDTFAPTEPTIDDLQRTPAEAGTQDEGQEIKGKRSDLAALLGGAEVLLGSRAQVAGGALAVANGLVRPEARHDIVDRPSMVAAQPEAGTQEDEDA